ncbi:hypothetical protein CHL76_14180 [Marinococcus halophilus]|uniref:Putative membrane protein YmcC n=1 Tax=Marinococcus halophilus TaxID=1371 RepID=A0A510Y901_MARHA|nr:hypothetical protein [Marinococcus halophilus]OZT79187.1 hypothetical protein CHL76_14180 [Marinococcus halophilus]GEK59850.1 putative membrane protein YmcC [Marinococcus halophilus]
MNFILLLIIGIEIAFWVVIAAGLIARYVFQLPRLGLFLLALTPVLDLILLIAASADLLRGAAATTAHAIAAIYIAVSIVFGKHMIRWADERFRYYIMRQGSKPSRLYGYAYSRKYFKDWLKHVLAYVLGTGLLWVVIFLVNDAGRTGALSGTIKLWSLVVMIDLVISITYFIWPREAKHREKIHE